MLTNLLTNATLPEGYQKVSVGTAALYALIGYLVVFAGIAFLIFIVWLVGKFMAKPKAAPKKVADEPVAVATPSQETVIEDEVDEETVAVIMAALMAYYETNYPKCEFTVKRIKRVRRNDYA